MKRICKECGKNVASGKSIVSFAAQTLGYCLYCYNMNYPTRRKRLRIPPLRMGAERVLSWSQRIRMEKAGFNKKCWSPEFRKEMEEYWKARMKGEI